MKKCLLWLLVILPALPFTAQAESGYVGDEFYLSPPSVPYKATKIKSVTWSGKYHYGLSCSGGYGATDKLHVMITDYFEGSASISCEISYEWQNAGYTNTSSVYEYYTIQCKKVDIIVSNSSMTLRIGEKRQIDYYFSAKSPSLTFTSSDNNVATVNSLGEVTAKSVGNARITIEQNMGDDAYCDVTVTEDGGDDVGGGEGTPTEALCGDNVTYSFDSSTGILSIKGTGAMYDFYYFSTPAPWKNQIDKIKTVEIAEGVTSIGDYAFYNCSELRSVTIPNSVTSIGKSAFGVCKSLTYIIIPSNVTSIGESVFYANNLAYISVADGNTIYDSRNNCNGIIEKASNALIAGCKNTVIPSDVKSIGDYAFWYCTGLTSVNIPNSVTTIGWGAFWYCTGLTSVNIPSSVTNIHGLAFGDCSALVDIYNSAASPQNIYSGTFSNYSATLHVLPGCSDVYRAANVWKDFQTIVEDGVSGINGVKAGKNTTVTATYGLDGKVMTSNNRGILILRMSDGTTKKVVRK